VNYTKLTEVKTTTELLKKVVSRRFVLLLSKIHTFYSWNLQITTTKSTPTDPIL